MRQQLVAARPRRAMILPERRDELRFALQPQEIVPQVIAERAGIVDGVREQIVDASTMGALLASQVERFPRQIRMSADERVQPLHIGVAERFGMERVQRATCSGSKSSSGSTTPTLNGDSCGRSMKNCGSVEVERIMSSFFQRLADRMRPQAVPAPQHARRSPPKTMVRKIESVSSIASIKGAFNDCRIWRST